MTEQKKLSVVSLCFSGSETLLVTRSIIETYLRESRYKNLIVLVEEMIYDQFVADWQLNYTKILSKTTTSASTTPTGSDDDINNNDDQEQNKEVTGDDLDIKIDLNCIDLKTAHRMSGRRINVVKFRSISELSKLINQLRKVPYMQLWTRDYLLARELCLKSSQLHQSNEFWLYHLPLSLTERKFHECLLEYDRNSMRDHMNEIYSEVFYNYATDIERLRKLQANFVNRRNLATRSKQVIRTYLSLISKFKSMKQINTSISESAIKLKRFQLNSFGFVQECSGDSSIETVLKPLGLAIIVIMDDNCIKSKSVLVEFIFKNLLLGNGVFLICAPSLLGLRFPMDLIQQHGLPFVMVDPKRPMVRPIDELSSSPPTATVSCEGGEISHVSIDSGIEPNNLHEPSRKLIKCPRSVYAVEFNCDSPELTSEKVETMVLSLGSNRRSMHISPLFYPDGSLHSYNLFARELDGAAGAIATP